MGEEAVSTEDPQLQALGGADDDATQAAQRIRELIRERIRDGIVAALLAIPVLGDRQARILLVELVAEAAGRTVSLREQPTAQLHLLELFRFCAAAEDGVSVLARCIPAIERDCPQAPAVQRLADEWNALRAAPDLVHSWDLLEQVMRGLPLTRSARIRLLAESTASPSLLLPKHCDSAWSDLLHLMGQNAAPARLPPWMIYLDRATSWMDYEVGRELRARNRKWAFAWDISAELDRIRWVSPPSLHGTVRQYQEYLAIQISAEPLLEDRYVVSHCFLTDARGGGWEPGEARREVGRDELEKAVSELVAEVERVNGDRAARLWLEFILPFELLNLPVDWWPRDAGESPGVPLALDYPVVVRSLDRLVNGDWHRRWRNRWDRLLIGEPPATSVFMNTVGHQEPQRWSLESQLSDEQYVALVLSEPPAPDRPQGHREIRAALRSGLPVVIWHRTGGQDSEFQHALEDLLAEGLQNLPARLTAYRRQAAGCAPEHQAEHLGRHITILWDDPDRKPILSQPY